MGYLIMGGQLILSLSILIVLHELGHFTPARLFNTRVEKFFLFFDAGFKLFSTKIGDTEWGIGWLPLGGYVKISGMIDESFDSDQLEAEPQPWEFRSKPAWQRLIIMLGGVTVNFLLGFFIYAMILFGYGREYLPNENVTYGIAADSLGQELGLRSGDQIVSINGEPFTEFNDRRVLQAIVIDNANTMTVERDGNQQTIAIGDEWADILSRYKNKERGLFSLRLPFTVSSVTDDSPAVKAGLRAGDKIVALNDTPTQFYDQFVDAVKGKGGQEVTVSLEREGEGRLTKSLTLSEEGKIGAYAEPFTYYYDTERQEYGLAESFPAGFNQGVDFLGSQFKAFGQMFRGKIKVTESLGGFASIGSMFGQVWNWERFWNLTAALSLILAFMNLLPIPGLDGGHVIFLLYEIASGRKPSDKFMERATMAGLIIVMGLLIFANGLDIWRNL